MTFNQIKETKENTRNGLKNNEYVSVNESIKNATKILFRINSLIISQITEIDKKKSKRTINV